MNFTIGIIAAVGVLIAFSLVMISMDPSRVLEPPVKPVEEKPAVCTKEYLPVCGVDGITYGNNCMLDAAKIELDYSGECIEVKPLEEGWQRLESAQHQGVGHESHQAVVILPLGDKIYSGTLQYAATEPVQLITLHGPLFEGEEKGQSTWTPDGVTKYALTFVDQQSASGEWIFSGNALLIHTKKTEPFMVDYKLDYTEKEISEYVKTGTILSQQDPALGHESHQLAMIIEPTSEIYSGILSYSASEPVQLVSLRGPLGPTERPVAAWSPDGQTIYALTLVDSASKMDSWKFSGNALAVHTMNTTQFTVTYSVSATAESLEIPKITTPIVPMNHTVSIPQGVASPGCETASECYLPNSLEIRVHDTVIWSNDDTAAHTVSSGNPIDGIDGKFDSSLFMSGTTFAYTFDEAGEYSYYCMVHPWMTGQVVVNEIKDMIVNEIAVDEPAPETVPTSESTLPEIVQDNSTQSEISVNATESTHISEPETEISEPVNATDSVPVSEKRAAPVEVMIAQGSGTPGCDATLECYLPHQAEIYPNEPVVWLNPDSAPHTITSGVPGTPDGLFDSGMLMSGQSWEFLFTESGDYDYYCMVHPWMTGKVTVI